MGAMPAAVLMGGGGGRWGLTCPLQIVSSIFTRGVTVGPASGGDQGSGGVGIQDAGPRHLPAQGKGRAGHVGCIAGACAQTRQQWGLSGCQGACVCCRTQDKVSGIWSGLLGFALGPDKVEG